MDIAPMPSSSMTTKPATAEAKPKGGSKRGPKPNKKFAKQEEEVIDLVTSAGSTEAVKTPAPTRKRVGRLPKSAAKRKCLSPTHVDEPPGTPSTVACTDSDETLLAMESPPPVKKQRKKSSVKAETTDEPPLEAFVSFCLDKHIDVLPTMV